jgi:hypothetical protein
MRVTLRPVLNEDTLVAQNPNAWRGSIEPADPSAWFASYRGFLLPYARVAQSAHAATLVIGTELNSLGGNPGWPALVRAISSVYRGQLAYDENFDSFQNHDTNLPVPTFGVDAYPRFQLPDSASVGELARSWEGWLGSHSAGVLHKMVLSEVGIAAVAGAYVGAWLGTADFDRVRPGELVLSGMPAFGQETRLDLLVEVNSMPIPPSPPTSSAIASLSWTGQRNT